MVYGLVKQSAGHIKIYSEEGHGTTIKIYLPPGRAAAAAGKRRSPTMIEGGHETILVVEDDRLVRDYVLAQLRSLGYVTLQAANAAEALAVIASGPAVSTCCSPTSIMPGNMNGYGSWPTRSRAPRPGPESALHLGLYRERHHPSRPAGFRRASAGQAVSQVGYGADNSQGAEQPRMIRALDTARRETTAVSPRPEARRRDGRSRSN